MDTSRRSAWVIVVITAALGAVSATSPVAGGDVSGQSAVTDAVLTPDSPSLDASALATLVLNGPLASGSGTVSLVVDLPVEAVSGLHFALSNDTTGEANDVDVLDPALQPEASIGIGAFDGCSPEEACEETLSLHFERIDDGIADDLPFSFYLLGSVQYDDEASEGGELTFDVVQ